MFRIFSVRTLILNSKNSWLFAGFMEARLWPVGHLLQKIMWLGLSVRKKRLAIAHRIAAVLMREYMSKLKRLEKFSLFYCTNMTTPACRNWFCLVINTTWWMIIQTSFMMYVSDWMVFFFSFFGKNKLFERTFCL